MLGLELAFGGWPLGILLLGSFGDIDEKEEIIEIKRYILLGTIYITSLELAS